jgi:hypothetical protein
VQGVILAVALTSCGKQAADHATTVTSEHGMKFDRIEYAVAEMAQAPQSLLIAASGDARYESHRSTGTPEIGVYEWTVPAGDLASLGGALGGVSLASLPDHMGRILAGDRFRKLTVISGSEVTEKAVGTAQPIDARLLALMNQLDALATRVAEHPRQVLGIEVADVSMGANRTVDLTLTLSSRGTQAVVCRSPVALVGAPDGWVSIQLWPNVPVAQLAAGDILRAVANKVDDRRDPPSFAAVLELPPGGSASFRVQAKLPDAKAGASVVRVSYASFAPGASGRPLLIGEVLSKTVKIDVPAGSAR